MRSCLIILKGAMDEFRKQNSGLMEPIISDNARYIAETRYAMKDENGQTTEKVKDIFWRVAKAVAEGDLRFTNNDLGIEQVEI